MRSETLFISYLQQDYHFDKYILDIHNIPLKHIWIHYIFEFALNLGLYYPFVSRTHHLNWVKEEYANQIKLWTQR